MPLKSERQLSIVFRLQPQKSVYPFMVLYKYFLWKFGEIMLELKLKGPRIIHMQVIFQVFLRAFYQI